jgi:D-alanyl-D-alanine carboxypeptidase/D-alanyl-D-alanine-endopeptidase (penicillin-binding protein 4)
MSRVVAFSLAIAIAPLAAAQVRERVEDVLKDPYLHNIEVGIKLVRLSDKPDADQTLYERRPDVPFTPASNLKVITTSAAMDLLGVDFKFSTLLVQKDQSLALVGDGDPTLGDAELLKNADWKSTTLFTKWAEALSARGLKEAAELVYDDSIFDAEYQHPSWPADQIQKRYVAGVAGLNFNANCLDFFLKPNARGEVVSYQTDPPNVGIPIQNNCTLGSKNAVWLSRAKGSDTIILRGETNAANVEPISVTINNPPAFTADVFARTFAEAGIAIKGEPKRDPLIHKSIKNWTVLAVHETPIGQVLTRANKDSMNIYAEALCKRIGAKATGEPGTWANGTQAMGKYLQSLGIPENQFSLDDGSGLSRKNALSPDAMITVLRHQFHSRNRDVFISTFSVGGIDGTLEHRFDNTRLKERVFAKSGFIDGVSTLSGYVRGKDDQWYAFSILFNGIAKGTIATAKKFQERIVLTLE